jgi:thioredoxin family protein
LAYFIVILKKKITVVKRSILLLLIIISFISYSQNITVSGHCENQPDKLARIIVYADGFSRLEKTIAQSKTDNRGDFTLHPDLKHTQFAYFALELDKGEFYLSPGASYLIDVPADTTTIKGSIFDRLPLSFIVNSDDRGLQEAIEEFNVLYNDFIYNNVNSIYKSRDKSVVSRFINEINEKFSNESEFVSNYISYSLGYLSWLSKKEKNQEILDKYFINKPILYHNIQYTDFFKEFFRSYFSSENTFRYEDIIPAINSKHSLGLLDDLISRDTLLRKDKNIREIVSMLLLSRYYHDRYVEKDIVIEKFDDISKNSQSPENKKIANNFIIKLQKLQNNTLAPAINLLGVDNDSILLGDYRGRFVLLCFVVENCRMCDFHKSILKDIKERGGNKFEILTIISDNGIDNNSYTNNMATSDWQVVEIGENILLLEDYNIETYPTYILINPDGTVGYAHLPMPDENMEIYIERFIESYSKRNK